MAKVFLWHFSALVKVYFYNLIGKWKRLCQTVRGGLRALAAERCNEQRWMGITGTKMPGKWNSILNKFPIFRIREGGEMRNFDGKLLSSRVKMRFLHFNFKAKFSIRSEVGFASGLSWQVPPSFACSFFASRALFLSISRSSLIGGRNSPNWIIATSSLSVVGQIQQILPSFGILREFLLTDHPNFPM